MTSSYNNDEELGRLKKEEDKKINEEYKDITDPKDPGDLLTPEEEQEPLYKRIIDALNPYDHRDIYNPLGLDTLGQRWQDKTIGKEWREGQMADVWDLLPDEWKPGVAEWGKGMAEKFGTAWMDARTLEGKEWLDPGKIAAAGTARTIETIGLPFEVLAQGVSQASGLDIELSRLAVDFVPIGKAANKINQIRLRNRVTRVGTEAEKIDVIDNLVNTDKINEAIEFANANNMGIQFSLRDWDSLTRIEKIKRALRQPQETLEKALQGELDFGPQILPSEKYGAQRVLEALVADKQSGYKSFGEFKRKVLNQLPNKELNQIYRQLNETTSKYTEGYIEHMIAKGRHMDWYWDILKKADRDFVDNVRILFNPRLKNLKDTAEGILYGTFGKDGVFIPSKYNKNPNLSQRLVISIEDPQKRFSVLKRQNPGDIVIKRAGSGEVIGRLGQYLDILYPQGSAKRVFTDGLAQIGIVGSDAITAWRRKIIQDRIDIIINEAPNLNKIPKRKRAEYIQGIIQGDMTDLLDKYDFLPPQKFIQKQLNQDGGPFLTKTQMQNTEQAKRIKSQNKQGDLF